MQNKEEHPIYFSNKYHLSKITTYNYSLRYNYKLYKDKAVGNKIVKNETEFNNFNEFITLSKLKQLRDLNFTLQIKFTTLTEKYNELQILVCSYTKIKEIPRELTNLTELYLDETPIKEIPNTLINLKILWCCNTHIEEIPNELINLNIILCENTPIIKIPKTFINLTYLDCIDSKVLKISKKFINLEYLTCSENIKKIPEELIKLRHLYFQNKFVDL